MQHKMGGKPIFKYLLLTFLIAWGAEAVLILGGQLGFFAGTVGIVVTYAIIGLGPGFAPAYAFYILLKNNNKISGLKDFDKIIFKTSSIKKTVFITAAFFCSQLAVYMYCESYLGNPWYCFILYIPLMVIGGGIEEVGWRGFLQTALEERFPFVAVALLEGIIWSIWHFPLWFVKSTTQSSMNFLSFSLYCIVFTFVLAALYKLTRCIFACVILHAWGNVVFGGMFTFNSLTNLPSTKIIVVYIIEMVIAVAIGVLIDRRYIKLNKAS